MGEPQSIHPKEDGSLRLYIYYLKSNEITIQDSYPSPCMDQFIDLLGVVTIFLTHDTNLVYWQAEIDPDHHEKTSFPRKMASSSAQKCQASSAIPPPHFKEP